MSWNNVIPIGLYSGLSSTRDLVGSNDVEMATNIVIEVADEKDPTVKNRHVFGYAKTTSLFNLSSPILEETDEYFQTRSRKYWKGEELQNLTIGEASELAWFLSRWGFSIEDQLEIIKPHSFHPMSIKDGRLDYGYAFPLPSQPEW